MSAQECSHVWSEVLITAKAFRRTVPPGSHGSASKYGPARLKFIRRVGHLENDPLISSSGLAVTLDYPRIRRSENLRVRYPLGRRPAGVKPVCDQGIDA